MDLFEAKSAASVQEGPLAARMRPRTLDEYIGQDHIVGKGRLLRRAIAADQLTSVIFYGPPGTGKTTLARVIANHTKSSFITLNAVLSGVQQIRDSIAKAEEHRNLYGRKTILFVDEVHRWNKSQQDALLPWVENGTFILVGATTENPFFEVNKALVSRSRVFQLKPLTSIDLKNAALAAIHDKERGYGRWNVVFEDGALDHLVETANGDARSLLNALELAIETTPNEWKPNLDPCIPPEGTQIYISRETAEESIQRKVVLYDKDGDYHYDIISAFIKSLRGRDPDAALYWMARMIAAGEDPHFIFRRMLISACEDTGLADPHAITVVESCAAAFDRVGLPEGRYHLVHAALYLSTAPKSNSALAFFDALAAVEREDAEVPNHLRDPSRDGEGFGHGAGYLYPHSYRNHWVAQQYLPDTLSGRVFYTPSSQGYEQTIRADVLSRRELQIAAMQEEMNMNAWGVLPGGEDIDSSTKQADSSDKGHTFAADGQDRTAADGGQSSVQDKGGVSAAGEQLTSFRSSHFSGLSHVKTGENLTFSPGEKQRVTFQKRLDSNKAEILLQLRDTAVSLAKPVRHERCLVVNADDGLFLWELWRKVPEGLAAGSCRTERGVTLLKQYASTLPGIEQPIISLQSSEGIEHTFLQTIFDCVFFRDIVQTALSTSENNGQTSSGRETCRQTARQIHSYTENRNFLSADGRIVIVQKIPSKTQRVADLLLPLIPEEHEILTKMKQAEDSFFTGADGGPLSYMFSWDENTLTSAVQDELTNTDGKHGSPLPFDLFCTVKEMKEVRRITQADIEKWFFSSSSPYTAYLRSQLGDESVQEAASLCMRSLANRETQWSSGTAFVLIAPAPKK